MKYLYNPIEDGAPIKDFIHEFKKYEHPVGKIIQYDDKVGEVLLETFGFLQDLSKKEAEQKAQEKNLPFKCTQCPKTFAAKIALIGHLRSHPEVEEEPLDPSIVPFAEGQPTNTFDGPNVAQMQRQANPEQVNKVGLTDKETDDNAAILDLGSYEKHA